MSGTCRTLFQLFFLFNYVHLLYRDKHERALYDTIHVLSTNPVVLYSMQVF
jgi:hypothetical protein